MQPADTVLRLAGALFLAASSVGAQSSNDAPLNNGGEFYYIYSDPSIGFPTGTFPPD